MESPVERPLTIVLLVLGFTLLFSSMTTFVKLAAIEGIPVVDIMFWRFFFGLLPVLFWLNRRESLMRELKNPEWAALSTRAFMGLIAMWCTFKSFEILPVAEATVLHFASPFIVTILSIPVLGEKVGPWRWGAVIIGFIGIVFILRPDIDANRTGQFIALCAALIMSLNMLLVRTLQGRVTSQGITLYFHLVGALVMLPFLILNWETPSLLGWVYLILCGVSAGIAQILLNQAYLTAPAAFVSSFTYIQIVFVTLLGWFVFGNLPTQSFLIGAGIVVAGGVVIAVREALLRKKISVIEKTL